MIGCYVTALAGHDKAQLYIVVREEGDYVYLCDGRCRPLERPKKKRLKHIQRTNRYVEPALLEKLQQGGARDEDLKYALRQYAAGK